jgi:hypothetical protein
VQITQMRRLTLSPRRFCPDYGQTGMYGRQLTLEGRQPEVGFEEIASALLQARFWITSGWPTTRQVTVYLRSF